MPRFPNPLDALARLHGQLFPWVPVCLAIGIGTYFALAEEPGQVFYSAVGGAAALGALLWLRGHYSVRPLGAVIFLLALGLLAAGARAHLVAAPVLDFRYYGPVEGRIRLIDRSSSDQIRLTLDRVVLERMAPERTPRKVRITIGRTPPPMPLEPGQTVILTGFLSAPSGPAEPGGFDFQRMAWFLKLGAVGFSRSPVLALAPPEPGQVELVFSRLRQSISDAIRRDFPTDAGGFVTAVLTNDVSGISQDRLDNLRASNLAHILSVSGLHMALLTSFVFVTLRSAIALVPPLALRLSSKKLAAGVGLAAAAMYLGLSGGGVATQRSFIMVAVMLLAVLADRRAISLRSVSIAAILVLLLEPESLTQPGFQMSFAATVALVAAFQALRDRPAEAWAPPRWLVPVLTLLLSSLVAGAATAPFGAAAFNRVSGYGLLANMLAVPLMGVVLMPAAVVAAVLSPFGLAWPALWIMEQGARWILWVSDLVAGLSGAVVPVAAPAPASLPLLSLGMLWVILIPGRARWGGVPVVVAAFALWGMAERPAVLISENARLVGLLTDAGRVLSKGRGEGFAATSWLENDGDLVAQTDAHVRAGLSLSPGRVTFGLADRQVIVLTGAEAAATAADACRSAALVIVADRPASVEPAVAAVLPVAGTRPTAATPDGSPAATGCLLLDSEALARKGALAIHIGKNQGLRLVGARESAGNRLWNQMPHRAGPVSEPTGNVPD